MLWSKACVEHLFLYIRSYVTYNPRVTQTWQLPYLLFLWVRQQCSLMCALWAYTVSASSCSICRSMQACVFVWGADGQCTLTAVVICITCEGVTWTCHRAWEPKKSYVSPHPGRRGPPISLSGRHLLRLWPRSSLEILLPKDSWREGSCCKSDSRRLSGEKSAGCGHFWSPVLLSDCTTMGGTGCMCTGLWCSVCVRPYSL